MKKRWTAILLAAALVLTLLPVGAFGAETAPEGWTPIYTLADIQDQCGSENQKFILMNDIDANSGEVTYYKPSVDPPSLAQHLGEGSVFDGNGHTIYNLKTGLFMWNEGTVRNLNVTIHDTETDATHLRDYGVASYTGESSYFGISMNNDGLIETCNVAMTVQLSGYKFYFSGIANHNGGTIRDCVAQMDIDVTVSGYLSGVSFGGICRYSGDDSLIDHCLVLGSFSGSGEQAFASSAVGLTSLRSTARCVDSACALEELSLVCQNEYYFYPAFEFAGNCSTDSAENCRAASDMKIEHVVTEKNINESGTVTAGEGYTLASRASILADWDLSSTPSTNPTGPEASGADPFPQGTAEFYYTASGSGAVKKYSFWYDSDFFNQGAVLQPELAVASLCLEMASFSNGDDLAWSKTLAEEDTRRAYNIQRLYETLGFTNARYVNYDKPLTDTSDKVAFSMAMKYIDNGKGGTDTLVAIPIRGSGYGGEWGSNFDLTTTKVSNYVHHNGFWAAMGDVWTGLDAYVAELEEQGAITGELKLWVTGFSRGAAVANLLAHEIMRHDDLGGVTVARKNLYAYTFATPAGMSEEFFRRSGDPDDSNIYNLISPVDVVPRVAPSQWGYGRYGVTTKLSSTMSDELCEHFRQLSDAQGDVKIDPSQRILLNDLLDWTCDLVPDALNYCSSGLQELLTKGAGAKLGADPASQAAEDDQTGLVEGLQLVMTGIKAIKHPVTTLIKQGVKYSLEQELEKAINHVSYAHYPERYLCQLEQAVKDSADLMEEAEEKQLLIPEKSVNVRFWEHSGNSQSVAGSYVNGVCTSGEVTVEETAQGIVATFPAGKDYSFTVSGAGADQFGYIAYVYDSDTDGPARTLEFTDLPLAGGETYTGNVPEDPYGDYYAEDSEGLLWEPDYDSEVDGERPLEYAHEISFTDVSPDAYYYDAVLWAVEEGITSGTSATTFSPDMVCTRAQAVTFLWRAAGSPRPEGTRNPFTDVKAGSYYYDAVLWAVEEGITSGTSATTFSPDMTCSRSQIVTLLYRSWGNPEIEEAASFRDVPAGAYYAEAVSWAAEWGITSGTSAATFSPDASCTRAQIVTFLYRSYC